MGRDKFSFDGLESIEDRIRRRAEEISYIAVWDRTDRTKEEPLGRFDFTPDEAIAWMERAPDPTDEEDEEEDNGVDPAFEDDAPSELADASGPRAPSMADLAECACNWLRDLAIRNTLGEPRCRFRVRICGPKGLSTLDSGQFACKNHGYQDERDEALVRDLKIPVPGWEEAGKAGIAKGMRALGDYYSQWGGIVLGSMGQMQGVTNTVVARLSNQLDESRSQVDKLIAALLEFRFRAAQADVAATHEERGSEARTLLVHDAIQHIGEAIKIGISSRNLPSELSEVVMAMGSCPELVTALADPEVRLLMKEPRNLQAIAGMIRGIAAQARAAREMGQPPDAMGAPPTPDPSSAPNPSPVAA